MNPSPLQTIIKDNWFFIVFIGSVIVTWTTFGGRLASAEEKINSFSSVITQINDINLDLVKIQKDIEYIKDRI